MKPFYARLAALLLASVGALACGHPTDPVVLPNQPESATGSEARGDEETSGVLPPPPSGTLRAPSDSRTEEVESTSGLPTPQSQ
jgi:hypothetical protein